MRKKVPSLPCAPPSFKNRSCFHAKALPPVAGRAFAWKVMMPHAVCDALASRHPSFQKGTCTQAVPDEERQTSRVHFDGRSSPGPSCPQGSLGIAHHSRKPTFSCGCPDPGCHHRAGCHRAPGFPRPNERFKTKRPAQGRLPKYGLRHRPPPHNDGDRHTVLEKGFSGLAGGLGEGRGSFYNKRPFLPPATPPGKNHASTGRRASMAALSRTRWLELPRKSSSRSRNAST